MEQLSVISYNCRSLPKSRVDLGLRPDIKCLFGKCSVLCLQEMWYTKQDLKQLNSLHHEFIGIGTTRFDNSEGLCNARGGVAIMYRKNIAKYIKQFETNLDWCNAVELNIDSHRVIILNVYMPYQCQENRETYIQCLGALKSLIDELPSTSFMIVGDWNANLKIGGNSRFGTLMTDFCRDNSLTISDKELLPETSYTYISDSSDSTTWIDHIVSSNDIQNAIGNINIAYDLTENYNILLTMRLNLQLTPVLSNNNVNVCDSKIKWDNFTSTEIEKYCSCTDDYLGKVRLHANTFACTDLKCDNADHKDNIDRLYEDIANSMVLSGDKIARSQNSNYVHKPV